ncbi:MAG: ABC transporter ATP-binding protein [Telmatospirillum sp.]|nr:ABC transporter ATP-binding protein [Telmatospirillum sp.]
MIAGGADKTAAPPKVVSIRGVGKTFRRGGARIRALDNVSLDADAGSLVALVGPDGAGKTTLLRMIAGLVSIDTGSVAVLGFDAARDPQSIQSRIGYMPQRFGLYEDLSVQENMDLYADLNGVTAAERRERYPRLMEMTDLGRFLDRPAGKLSGGMKQKLGLACTLVRPPRLLLLDEPTVGVDPLSRRELWEIILHLVRDDKLTAIVSTAALDEAERCDRALLMHLGKVLSEGSPEAIAGRAEGRVFLADPGPDEPARRLQSRLLDDDAVLDAVPEGGQVHLVMRQGCGPAAVGLSPEPALPRFEDGFMTLLHEAGAGGHAAGGAMTLARPPEKGADDVAIEVSDLVKTFGDFVAVDHVSFRVRRGEIFGLLGPNGAGKTTTFRMLCGLLAASGGTLRVAGEDLRVAGASARQKVGYVAQKFALYSQLSVRENLDFYASAYGLSGRARRDRIEWAMTQFELTELARVVSGQLPGGFKQRLSMAAALMHGPEILFLDEPTSGADPLARREFWRRITALSDQGVTVIVTTHFMEEAEYCDHAVIQDAGRILAKGTPAEIRARARAQPGGRPTMEDAFIAIVEEARARPHEKPVDKSGVRGGPS